MDSVARGIATYLFVWLIIRIAGKKTLSKATTFDLVLLLIMSETLQSALNQNDNSLTNSFLIIVTLVSLDILVSWVTFRFPVLESVINSRALIIIDNGRILHGNMRRERITLEDILSAARETQGLESLEQIKFAILETNGQIAIIPKDRPAG